MAGSTLFRNGSMRGVWLKVVGRGWIHHWSMGFMWCVVVSCTCSAATTNIGSIKIHMARRKAWPGFTWPSWHWNRGLMHWGCDLRKTRIMLAWLSGAEYWLELGKRRWSKMSIIVGKNVMSSILTHYCTEEMVCGWAFKGSLWLDKLFRLTVESLVSTKSLSFTLWCDSPTCSQEWAVALVPAEEKWIIAITTSRRGWGFTVNYQESWQARNIFFIVRSSPSNVLDHLIYKMQTIVYLHC